MSRPVYQFLLCIVLGAPGFIHAGSSTNTQERHQQYQEPEQNGETVEYEWSGGGWQYESVAGTFRFIISRAVESEANKLYLQWWRALESGDKELSYTLSVKELNSTPVYTFSRIECLNKECNALLVKAMHLYEEYEQDILIDLVALGRYKMSW